jgi:hypothetical protein
LGVKGKKLPNMGNESMYYGEVQENIEAWTPIDNQVSQIYHG